jgi:hypothetical protein
MIKSIVGPTRLIGKRISFSLGPSERIEYIRKFLPSEIPLNKTLKLFKKDIFLDSIVEKIDNAKLYYVQLGSKNFDELYYIEANGVLFHGEKVWSDYHSFISQFANSRVSKVIEGPHWFVGSKNNFTHQLVDLFPNYLIAKEILSPAISTCNWIFGYKNNIIEQIKDSMGPVFCNINNLNSTYISDTTPSHSAPDLRIYCIQFEQLYLVRHISIFKAYELLQEHVTPKARQLDCKYFNQKEQTVGMLARGDQRITNQEQICSTISEQFHGKIIKDIAKHEYRDRIKMLSGINQLILPPGSDNINGLCFASSETRLIQMIGCKKNELLSSPFYSLAGLRYLLPFLHRTSFWEATHKNKGSLHSGYWDPQVLRNLL